MKRDIGYISQFDNAREYIMPKSTTNMYNGYGDSCLGSMVYCTGQYSVRFNQHHVQ